MPSPNQYDVTAWPIGDPYTDLGVVINSMLDDVRSRQTDTDLLDGGKPGALIRIPPGDYHLRTQVVIDRSFIRIEGAGHGFTSSSIRFNVPKDEWSGLHELWPGGSRVINDLTGTDEDGAAFVVRRQGDPRISSIEFSGFCIDGLHFTDDGSSREPENTYHNGKTGIRVEDPNDSFRITDMGLVYLEHALVLEKADALTVRDNFIAECGNCIELRGWGQASTISGNLLGAGPWGHSIYAEQHGGLLITGNNVFPRGASSVHLRGVTRSSVTANRLHSFYPGGVVLDGDSSENLVASNHILRDDEPWTPFLNVTNGQEDGYGLVHVEGSDNTITGNHLSAAIRSENIRPVATKPVILRIAAGEGNHVTNNHIVATDSTARAGGSAYAAQVDALLTRNRGRRLPVLAVVVDEASHSNVVLDTGLADQIRADRRVNAVRSTPSLEVATHNDTSS